MCLVMVLLRTRDNAKTIYSIAGSLKRFQDTSATSERICIKRDLSIPIEQDISKTLRAKPNQSIKHKKEQAMVLECF